MTGPGLIPPNSLMILSSLFPSTYDQVAGTFVADQAAALAKLCPATVIAPVAMPPPLRRFREERQAKSRIPWQTQDGYLIYRPRFLDSPVWAVYLNSYSMLASLAWLTLRHGLRPDVIHAHFAYPAGYVGVLLGRLLKRPVFITVHGYDIHVYAQVPSTSAHAAYADVAKTRRYRLARKATLFALRNCTGIIAVSKELQGWVVKLGIPPGKTAVIPNGVTTSQFFPMDRVEARRSLKLPMTKKILLYVGRLVEERDVSTLIKAISRAARSEDILLVIVGDGPLRGRLEQEARELLLPEQVRFVGARPHDEVARWMNTCDVFCLPTLYDTFGCVLLEAMACGKPVVATRVGGIPEVVQDGVHGFLVEPGDVTQMSDVLLAALHRPWDAAKLVAYAHQYSWDEVARRLMEQYELGGLRAR